MKKKSLLLLFLFYCVVAQAQGVLPKIAKDYFRSNPFSQGFGDFMQHLLNDPTLQNKNVRQRTDTSLYVFTGAYTTHRPYYFIRPEKVSIHLSEIIMAKPDTVAVNDTLIQYFLVASMPNNEANRRNMDREREKIMKRYNKGFAESQETTLDQGVIYNYFFSEYSMSPFAISTQVSGNETKLVIILRMKQSTNLTWIPW